MLRRNLLFLLSIITLVLAGCGESQSSGGNNDTSKKEKKEEAKLLTEDEFQKMFSDPKKYKDSAVDFYAKVFVEPERDSDGTYLQAYANNNDERNTIIGVKDPDLDLSVGDIIHVQGKVKDSFEGENAFGGQVTAPVIIADEIEKADYQTAFAPAYATIELNKIQDQHGYKLEVQKVELADKETRVYVKVSNEMDDKISFYSFNAKLTVNGKQFEEEVNYDAEYPEVQSDILPGVDTEGIIAFPAIPKEANQFKLYFEGSSDNYDIEIKPFVFEVNK